MNMKIKNNSIVIRKCNEKTWKKLQERGFKWKDESNKVLTLPFTVFNVDELEELFKEEDIKYYMVAINPQNYFYNDVFILLTEQFKLSSTLCGNVGFPNEHNESIEAIHEIVKTLSKSNDEYETFLINMVETAKNPLKCENEAFFFKHVREMGVEVFRLWVENTLSDFVREKVGSMREQYRNTYGKNATHVEIIEGLWQCFNEYCLEVMKNQYEESDIVLWYKAIDD